jgi:NAD-dependent dihydropyrimidine dehydrogenase PreA subunit
MVHIDRKRCTGCGACVEVCPTRAIQLVEDEMGRYVQLDQTLCRECQVCIEVCPEEAISVETEPAIEGELVLAEPETIQVKTGLPEPQPARPALRALAWLGPALAYVGREIVPRVAASLLEAWDRRASGSTPTLRVPEDSLSVRSARQSMSSAGNQRHLPGTGGGQYRWRRGRDR